MREKLERIREECRSREFCKGCKYELSDCVMYDGKENQFYPCKWTDGFIDWLSGETERYINADLILAMLDNVIKHGIPDEDGKHIVSAETVKEVIMEILENGRKD